MEVIELSGAEGQRGALDPLAIGMAELREELAVSYLLELLRDPPALLGARDRPRGPRRRARRRPRLPAVITALRALQTARRRGGRRRARGPRRLRARAPWLRRRHQTRSHGRATRRVTTIRTPGLTLPEPGAARETYTRAERVSVATLSLVAALALRLVSTDRARHKVVLLDEAWFLLASAQGRALINRLVRLGARLQRDRAAGHPAPGRRRRALRPRRHLVHVRPGLRRRGDPRA